jgi:hypothetical protein
MLLAKPPGPLNDRSTAIQQKITDCTPEEKERLIRNLLDNRISIEGLAGLRECVNAADLSNIIQQIYDLNEKYILELSAVDGALRKMNDIKNSRRNRHFLKRMRKGFRDPANKSHKVILAEGDSWFNYPIILTDIIDRISMENDFAIYSLAAGGDWFLSMLSARQYIEELSVLHPDVFLISGGGNDLVGSSRLAAIVEPNRCDEYEHNPWCRELIKNAAKRQEFLKLDKERFDDGVCYLSRDAFAVLMFFHLQYYSMIKAILSNPKFQNLQVITQGYDYPIPSDRKGFFNPLKWHVWLIRILLGHGIWLKTPLQMRGITNPEIQQKIMYALIYLFNEMMIQTGALLNSSLNRDAVYHIDSRGAVPKNGWSDELHPQSRYFMQIAEQFIRCIRHEKPTFDHTYVVNVNPRQ